MKIIPNTVVAVLPSLLQDVEIITGGHLTSKRSFKCKELEKVASANNGEKIDFYEDGKVGIFSFHFGRSLGPGMTILAIDFFPSLSSEKVVQALDLLMAEIRKLR